MPKLSGPLFSLEARKALAKTLTYHRRPSGAAVGKYVKPGSVVRSHAEPSAGQVVMREYYKEAFEHWGMLTDEEKEQWNDFVGGG